MVDPGSEISAAALIIGNEMLSGRTQDTNVQTLARFLDPLGIDLREVRFVPDSQDQIVAALNAMRARYTYVFTTGGIGPTHDDITADAIAAAFAVGIDFHPDALALLEARYGSDQFTPARRRMARIPAGARLIANPVSIAPGFQIDNVFVLAGVPRIMRAMLDDVAPRLARGQRRLVRSLTAQIGEGRIALGLEAIQRTYSGVDIGSYPFFNDEKGVVLGGGSGASTTLVISGRDLAAVEAASAAVADMVRSLGVEPQDDAACDRR